MAGTGDDRPVGTGDAGRGAAPGVLATAFEALAGSAPDGIITIDHRSTILSANPAVERIFGWSPAELVGRPLATLMPERFREAHDAGIARFLATGTRHIPWTGVALPGLTKDGREIPLEISFGLYHDEEGQPVFSGFLRDISARERELRALAQARATAERALVELGTLSEITDVALAQHTYEEMVATLLARLRQALRADTATLLLVADEGPELRVFASDGLRSEVQAGVRVPLGRGISGSVAARGQPRVIDDVGAEPEVLSDFLREHIASLVAVPVRVGGTDDAVIGVLHVGSIAPRHFRDGDVRLLEVVADRMAGVFARVRLYEAEQRARAAAEEARRADAERASVWRAIFEQAAVGITRATLDGVWLEVNPALSRMLGRAREELVGRHVDEVTHPDDRAAGALESAQLQRLVAGEIPSYTLEKRYLRPDGEVIWARVSLSVARDAAGVALYRVGIIEDITQQRAAKEELGRVNAELAARADEERALRTLAQSITAAVRLPEVMHQIAEGAIAVSGAAGAYVEQVIAPDGLVEVVAVSGEHTPPVGQRVPFPGSLTEEIVTRPEPVFLMWMHGVGAAMAPYLDAHCHGCSVLVVPLVTGDDRVLGALVLLRNAGEPAFEHGVVTRVRTLGDLASIALQRLTALAESERRRSEAEAAVRSRDEVLSVVSHDLRNPVHTVAMSASLLEDTEMALSDEQRRAQVQIIARSAQRMNRLIQDLLDASRIEGGRFTVKCECQRPAPLATEVCEAFGQIAGERGQRVCCECAPELPLVLVDRDRVVQVLSNYLNNAIKFSPRGAEITVRVEPDPERGGVRFGVRDNGPGIAPEALPDVFDRYWQARATAHMGAGLGLAIAKGIAEAHGGRVWAESTVGAGSTFWLWLPASPHCGG